MLQNKLLIFVACCNVALKHRLNRVIRHKEQVKKSGKIKWQKDSEYQLSWLFVLNTNQYWIKCLLLFKFNAWRAVTDAFLGFDTQALLNVLSILCLTYFLIVSYFQIGLYLTVWKKKNLFLIQSQDKMPIEYTAKIDRTKNTWNGTAIIPIDYLPPHVGRINAYAIHGSGVNRRYESLYPASADVSDPDLWVKWSHCIVNYTIMHWLVKSSLFIFSTQKKTFSLIDEDLTLA